jgi:hypothetical protein
MVESLGQIKNIHMEVKLSYTIFIGVKEIST